MVGSWTRCNSGSFSECLRELLVEAEVSAVELIRFVRPHSFLGREVSDEARILTRQAREEYRRRGYGFWDALVSSSAATDTLTRRAVLSRALSQHESTVLRERVKLKEFLTKVENKAYSDLPEREIVAMTSRVTLQMGALDRHLPMIDFAIKSGPSNDDVMIDVAESLGLHGSIFDSGNSYHYYGARAVLNNELTRFLAKAQLISPFVDGRWISYQIMDGECSLRISTDRERHKVTHRLVASSLNQT